MVFGTADVTAALEALGGSGTKEEIAAAMGCALQAALIPIREAARGDLIAKGKPISGSNSIVWTLA
jgi:hypothetical protein